MRYSAGAEHPLSSGPSAQPAGRREYGWVSSGALALPLVLEVDAPTAARAEQAATARIEVPAGWRAEPAAAPLA